MQNSGWGLPRSVERGPDKSRSAFMDPDDRAITALQCIEIPELITMLVLNSNIYKSILQHPNVSEHCWMSDTTV